MAVVENFLLEGDKNTVYKIDQLKNNTSAHEDKAYRSVGNLEADLNKKIKIIKDGVMNNKSFNGVEIKNLKYSITKFSTIGKFINERKFFAVFSFFLALLGLYLFTNHEIETPSNKIDSSVFPIQFDAAKIIAISTMVIFTTILSVFLFYYPESVTNLFW